MPILRKSSHFPQIMSFFGCFLIRLSPPPQKILLYGFFLRLKSPSTSDIPIMRWVFWHSRLNNVLVVVQHQRQTQTFPSGGGASRVHVLTTRCAPFAVGCLKFTDLKFFGRPLPWGVLHLWINNALGVPLYLHLYPKIFLFIDFISYMFHQCFADLSVLMVCVVYFVSFFVHDIIPICIIIYCYYLL